MSTRISVESFMEINILGFLCNSLGREKTPKPRHQARFPLNRLGEEGEPAEESRRRGHRKGTEEGGEMITETKEINSFQLEERANSQRQKASRREER